MHVTVLLISFFLRLKRHNFTADYNNMKKNPTLPPFLRTMLLYYDVGHDGGTLSIKSKFFWSHLGLRTTAREDV